jgi:uncharacterized membrane protein YfcA
MFQIYLPIADIDVNLVVMLGLGAAVGFLSGMFGVGGGFLLTPLLMFSGVPPAIAVTTGANQIVASSLSGALAQWRRGNVDVTMGIVLIIGGLCGALPGVLLLKLLRAYGLADVVLKLVYVSFLGVIGSLMLVESAQTLRRQRQGKPVARKRPGQQHTWVQRLPFKMRFRRSKLYISAIPPLMTGAVAGVMVSLLGVGGGFIMIPAKIYILRMQTRVAIGTSLFQIIFITSAVTLMQAVFNQTLDIVLAFILIVGGVIGGQLGVNAGQKLRGEHIRFLLALMVLAVAVRLLLELVLKPSELYSIVPLHSA